MEGLTERVNEIVDLYSDATGHQLGARSPKSETVTKADEKTMREISETFYAIIAPESRHDAVFPYANAIASNSYDHLREDEELISQSLAVAMARAAALGGHSNGLIGKVRERMTNHSDKETLASVLIHVALAAENDEVLSDALNQFSTAIDSKLPKKGPKIAADPLSLTISTQVRQESQLKTKTINSVLLTVWPLTGKSEFSNSEISSLASDLLERTSWLIVSDPYTENRHRAIAKKIRKRMMTAAANRNDQEGIERLLNLELGTIDQRYAGYDTKRRQQYLLSAMESLLDEMMADGRIAKAPKGVRRIVLMTLGRHRSFRSSIAANLCLELSKLPKEKQFEYLMQFTFGEKNEKAIAHWGSFIRFNKPPEVVLRQTPNVNDIQALPVCDPDVPFASTLLMLADLSAELGKSQQVADALASRSDAAGDEADLASKIVLLTASVKDPKAASPRKAGETLVPKSFDPTIQAVTKKLVDNKPTKTDADLVFPELPFFFTVRAIQAGLPNSRAEELLQLLKTYAFRSKSYLIMSSVSRVQAELGIGRAAGAHESSPLEHFVVVTIPTKYGPDVERLMPLYSMDDEGWVSGTSGHYISLLMLRYPVTGSFTLSAEIQDGGWGEANVSYGGLLYKPNGANESAKLYVPASRGDVSFPITSIKKGKLNVEAIRVTENATVGLCNEAEYVTDLTNFAYPWPAISHYYYRTTKLRNINITGEPVIPREVNLINPTMRGWGVLALGRGLPNPMLPEKTTQTENEIDKILEKISGSKDAMWFVDKGELKYTAVSSNSNDVTGQIQYLRPLFDGESVEMSVWWDWGTSEVHPSIGRTVFKLGNDGMEPSWLSARYDLGETAYIEADKLDPPIAKMASDNVPKDKAWNLIKMTRRENIVSVTLNGNPLIDLPITEPPRPGIMRYKGNSVRISSIKLTGDWPKTLPTDLMMRAND